MEQELGYPQTNGTRVARVLRRSTGARPDHIQVTNGGSEANCILLRRLVQPGDEVVFMTPNYMQPSGRAGAGRAATVAAQRRRDGTTRGPWISTGCEGWLRQAPAAILLCNPDNPTGARLTADELDEDLPHRRQRGRLGDGRRDLPGRRTRGRRDADRLGPLRSRPWSPAGYQRHTASRPADRLGGRTRRRWSATLVIHDYTTIAPGAIKRPPGPVALAPSRRERSCSPGRAASCARTTPS